LDLDQVKAVAAKIGLVLLSAAVSLGLAEGGYRWSQFRPPEEPKDDTEWRDRYRTMNETIYQRSQLPGLVYEPRRGSTVPMEYGPAGFSEHGNRGAPIAPTDSHIKVAVMGDSIAWGEFKAVEEAIPAQVQKALNPDRYRVWNFGVTGYNTAQEALWYEQGVRPNAPDVVVVLFCMNDWLIMSGPYNRFANEAEKSAKKRQDQHFDRNLPLRRETLDQVGKRREEAATIKLIARAHTLWERQRFAQHYVDEYTWTARDADAKQVLTASLKRFGATLEQDGVQALLVISPILESWDTYPWEFIHTFVAGQARAAGFTVIDPLQEWRGQQEPADLRFHSDNLHYNPHGSALMGQAIANAIRELSP